MTIEVTFTVDKPVSEDLMFDVTEDLRHWDAAGSISRDFRTGHLLISASSEDEDIAVKEAKEKVETVLRLRNVYATVEASKFDTEGLE